MGKIRWLILLFFFIGIPCYAEGEIITETGILSVKTLPLLRSVGEVQLFFGEEENLEYIEYYGTKGHIRYYPEKKAIDGKEN